MALWMLLANTPGCVPAQRDYPAPMKDPIYKLVELTGTSTVSMEAAVQNAIKRAAKTLKNLCWFQVVETRGSIEKGKVHRWQVTLKVGFAIKD
jgi:flavin-binding protein dodecin